MSTDVSLHLRIGVIARTEIARGLAIQTRNFVEHMPVERTLVIDMPTADCALDESWCPNPTHITYDARHHTLDERIVRDWLRGLDVVFTVETPYDWRMPNWCREMDIPLVVQGNPEFVRHGQEGFEHLGDPIWWWPTSWRLDQLPHGDVVPVPMPDRPNVAANPRDDGPLKILHVIGKRAWADRNGTDILLRALTQVRQNMEVTIHTIDGAAPDMVRRHNVKVTKVLDPVADRWSMYEGHHILVLPRRYGGLCLPALEAAACGLAVGMPGASPNEELASLHFRVRRNDRTLRLACGQVKEVTTEHADLAHMLDSIAQTRSLLAATMRPPLGFARWSDGWADRYLQMLSEAHW